ncbi:hypothetical protein EZS27_004031 [termite gut metagenome]|uniref:DUF4141 domain-containing protein n=1 Tax=termite gut metagenome TaxID=433724 RepID=A0A5J4SR91_9ZZZZ
MQLKIILPLLALCLFAGRAGAQWVVLDPSNLAQGIANATKQIVQTSQTATNTVNTFKETAKLYDQTKGYYDALRKTSNLLKDARKVRNTMLMIGEITDMYVNNFRLMLSDGNYLPEELTAISFGYATLLGESADVLSELKNVINDGAFSMSDAERMVAIDKAYHAMLGYRNLVAYYTRKNISVSYLRAARKGDSDRIRALYGNAGERYW